MAEIRIHKRYAKALLELANEKDLLEAVKADIEGILESVKESRELELLLESPVIPSGTKRVVLKRIFEGKLSDLTFLFVMKVVQKGREEMLLGIFKQFLRLYNDYKGIAEATVFTAAPIDARLKEQIRQMLEAQMEKKVNLTSLVREDLIGGFLLRYEDKLVDSSVSNQLLELKKHLTA